MPRPSRLRQIANGDPPLDHLTAPHPEDQRHAQTKNELGKRDAPGPIIDGVHQPSEKDLLPGPKFIDLSGFAGKGLDDADAGDVFLDDGGHGAGEVMNFAPLGLEPAGG